MKNSMRRFTLIASVCLASVAVIACPSAWAQVVGIVGPDTFEPDDTPGQARWSPIFDEGATFGRPLYRHNFDRSGDVDWVKFIVPNDLFVFVRTTALLPKSNTFLSVYRYYPPGQPVPSPDRPVDCVDQLLALPNGGHLLAIACNDNFQGLARSEVSFNVDDTNGGLYFARIEYSFVPPDQGKSNEKGEGEGEAPDEGADTTYAFEASYFGVIPGTLVASVYDDATNNAITSAIVRLQPLNMTITDNVNGSYLLGAVPADTYTILVDAPGYESTSQVKSVSGGGLVSVVFPLVSVPGTHSGDYLAPFNKITLSELLRLIQFYNTGQYHCDPDGEDNFAPGSGSHGCPYHNTDYNPANWSISLSEILRMIQFYNSGGFSACDEGEDGFCPNP